MQSLKDISSYARYPRFKMHTLYLHLFFIFLLYFLLIGLRSVLFLNVEAVYHDMGPNSFYISMEQEQIEPCNDFIHQLYPDVETSEFVQQNIQIPRIFTNTKNSILIAVGSMTSFIRMMCPIFIAKNIIVP